MESKQIKTVEEIVKLANEGKCVIFKTSGHSEGRRIPAAFVQNYQARLLVSQIRARYYFTYTKQSYGRKTPNTKAKQSAS